MKKGYLLIFGLFLLSISFISAIPGIPHQFYGEINVNGELIKDNNIISAIIDGEEYSTITKNGMYGSNPNLLLVEDIFGDANGKTINFYVGGMEAGTYTFQNNAQTKLDFSLTTECGDGYCLGDETCSRCEEDCGECSTPTVYIESPLDKGVYETTKIDINVYSDQEIQIWMYSLNKETPIVFTPNITLTLFDGDYDLEVIGMNSAYKTGSEEVSFSVDLPYDYCGDNECVGDESCSNCPDDCGACQSSGGGSSGGGGGSSGGGGGFISNLINRLTNSNDENATESSPEANTGIPEESLEENTSNNEPKEETQDSVRFGDGITGAVVGFSKTTPGQIISWVLLFVSILGIILLVVHLKNKRKTKIIEDKSGEFLPETKEQQEQKEENFSEKPKDGSQE